MELHADLISFNWTLLMHAITVLVLFLILKKFFFEKVHNFILSREHAIQDAYDNAELTNQKADEKLSAYTRRIADVEGECREIIRTAKVKADGQAGEIIEEARQKAEAMMQNAREEIEREKAQAMLQVRDQIISYSLLAAERIMEKELKSEGQEAFIDKIIEEAGTTGWRN